MPSLSRYELTVVAAVSAAGAAVASASALAQSLDIQPPTDPNPTSQEQPGEITLTIPTIPRSCEELTHSIAENYVYAKDTLPKVFRFVGQMLVAPIVVVGLDAAYNAYTERCDVVKPSVKLGAISPDVRAAAVAGGCPVL